MRYYEKSLHSSPSGSGSADGAVAGIAEAAVLTDTAPPTTEPGGGGGRKNVFNPLAGPVPTALPA